MTLLTIQRNQVKVRHEIRADDVGSDTDAHDADTSDADAGDDKMEAAARAAGQAGARAARTTGNHRRRRPRSNP